MATEEQTTTNTNLEIGDTDSRAGQRLTISDRVITKLSFKLFKEGSPTGNVSFVIRKQSDDSIIVSKVLGDASTLQSGASPGVWEEVTFDTQHRINEEVYLLCEHSGGDNDNNVRIRISTSDEKASEYALRYIDLDGDYTEHSTWDAGYIYTYGGSSGSPVYKVFPAEAITRVTNLIHRYNRKEGVYTLEMALGEVTSDFGLPEWLSKPQPSVPEKVVDISFQERMERTAKQLEEEAGMSRQQALYIARKLETMEETARREQGARQYPAAPTPTASFAELMEQAKEVGLSPYEARKVAEYEVGTRGTRRTATPYKCPYCGAGFATAQEMWKHIAAAHPEHPRMGAR